MTSHRVTLVFEDGRTASITADEADSIYLAALKSRVRLETDCLEGTCATCKGLCTEGEYTLDDYLEEALSAEEAARREVLTCQMHVTTDAVIEFPYESSLALRDEPATRPGRVAEIETVSSAVVRLVVEVEDGEAPLGFLAGQYVHLGVPGTEAQRSYSFANPPAETNRLEFFIKALDEGVMSEYVSVRARAGDEMPVTGPFGRFYLRPLERPVLMVAGGTGLAPMLSMMDDMIARGATGQPVHLLYGANTPDELFAADRLAGYAGAGLELTVERAVVETAAGWDGPTGHVTALLRTELINGGDCDAYLCGPPPMIEAAESWLRDAGVEGARIHAEKFIAS